MEAARAAVVVALMGIPGSGKTTLASALAPMIPARTVSRDRVRDAMFDPCTFTDREKAAAFEGVLAAVAANCELGESTIVDGMPFSREGELEALRDTASAAGSRTLAVLCSVPVEEAQRRIRRQDAGGSPAEDRDPELAAQVAERFRQLPEGTVELDSTRPAAELAEAVLDELDAGGSPARG